jgi:hypothetical protein
MRSLVRKVRPSRPESARPTEARPAGAQDRAGERPVSPRRLPSTLRSGAEALSGLSLADVLVHYDSGIPARLGASAFAAGGAIHLGPGQERHLPHETWHVVQQMQGRVPATAGPADLSMNTEPRLEAEADRMGSAASRGARGQAVPLSSVTAAEPVVQRKVKDGEHWLKASDPMSPTLRSFVDSEQSYLLRDDFHGKLEQTPVHLLDMDRKYLLGETHGPAADARWARDVQFWSQAGKMLESEMTIPREQGDKGAFEEEPDPAQQPLESAHAWALYAALDSHNYLNMICSSWMKSNWPNDKPGVTGWIASAQKALDVAAATYWTEYYDFIATYEKRKARRPDAIDRIYRFAVNFRDRYLPAILEIKVWLKSLQKVVDQYDPAQGAPPTGLEGFDFPVEMIDKLRGALPDMARELLPINRIPAGGELDTLTGLLGKSEDFGDTLGAVKPVRERAMCASIKAAKSPLLVQMGENHVQSVADLVGRDVAVPIPESSDTLEAHTKKD